jgi:HemY protein
MIRLILFLVVIALAAAGAAWLADQPGGIVLSWRGWRAETSLAVFALVVAAALAAIALTWSIISGILRAPGRMKRKRRERKLARGRHAITQGLLAVGQGDTATARAQAIAARRNTPNEPLSLLLQAQAAQLDGDRAGARRAFLAMSSRDDTKALGLRGLYIEAQRADDADAALTIAEDALRASPSTAWAAQAVLSFRCARGDWNGALETLDNNLSAGLIDKQEHKRQRGVLLTARAIEVEERDRDLSRDSVLEAVKLAPTLVPAAVLASKYLVEVHQVRRAMKILETAWQANPHPDLAEAYTHVKSGDPARARLSRIESLAAKTPGQLEAGLAVARAAIDARDFAKARKALAPFVETPTRRVAMLMAELEHGERADSGASRSWALRAVRASQDPAWTADGYVSAEWRPASPVTGRLDAFQWQVPVSALPSSKAVALPADSFSEALLAPPVAALPPAVEPAPTPAPDPVAKQPESPARETPTAVSEPATPEPAPSKEPAADTVVPLPPPPLFQRRKTQAASAPVIPIVRAPDDPGIDNDATPDDEYAERTTSPSPTGTWQQPFRPRRDN